MRLRVLALTLMVAILVLATAAPAYADFVCPVLNSTVGQHNPNATPIAGGHYTVAPAGASNISVPDHATNKDGTGSPGGTHAAPGDRNYSAIWNTP